MTITTEQRQDRDERKNASVKTYEELRRTITAVEPVIREGAAHAIDRDRG